MADVGALDFKGFISTHDDPRPQGHAGREQAYAYVSDKQTRRIFDNMEPVELAVTAAVRIVKAIGRSELLGHSVKVGPRQFPRVYGLLRESAETLGVPTPSLYIKNSPVMNAMTFGTNEDSFIIVHSALIDHFSDEELRSVIGHETGHIHNKHVIYLTALHYLKHMVSAVLVPIAQPAMLALAGWQRRAEITCDRAGMLCSKSYDVSARALAKLALGSQKLYEEFDIDAFVEQYDEGQKGVGKYGEMAASHPWLPKRLVALKAFTESELYRKHTGLGTDGLSMDAVDEKVHEIIKVWG